MTYLRKTLGALMTTAALFTSPLSAADELKILPIFYDEEFCAETEVSLVGGYASFSSGAPASDSGVYGIEVSFGCPVFTLPGDHILRQQLVLSRASKNGFDVTIVEMQPYYFFRLSENLQLGVGPGIGAVHGDSDTRSDWAFAAHLGTGLKYYIGNDMLVGVDVRKQWTADKNFGNGEQSLDNLRTTLKVGYRF